MYGWDKGERLHELRVFIATSVYRMSDKASIDTTIQSFPVTPESTDTIYSFTLYSDITKLTSVLLRVLLNKVPTLP